MIATGSDQRFQDFFVESSTGKSQIGRNFEIANRVFFRLEAEELLYRELQNSERQNAIATISAVLDEAKIVEIIDRMQQRGVFRLLKVINEEDKRNEWIYRFANNEKFRNDLQFLRSEGLISYLYNDYDTIIVQDLARQVLRGPRFSSPSVRGYQLESSRYEDTPRLSSPTESDIEEVKLVGNYDAFDERQIAPIGIRFDFSWFSFSVSEPGKYIIDVLA